MEHVEWILVVLLTCSLTAFVEKDKLAGGLSEGDVTPDFKVELTSNGQPVSKLGNLKGKYVLLSFQTSYDAQSWMQNVSLDSALRSPRNVEMVSISFDEYQSIPEETVCKDQVVTPTCFVRTGGEDSGLLKKYRLNRGFTNYLLDGNGIIIAKDVSAVDLSTYVKGVG